MDTDAEILNLATELVWEKGEHPFSVTDTEYKQLEDGVEDDKLTAEGEIEKEGSISLSFASQTLLVESLARYAAEEVDEVWENLGAATKIFEHFNRLQYELKLPDNTWAQLFVELEKSYQRSILEWLDNTTGLNPEGHNSPFWSVYQPFCDAIVAIKPDPDRLAEVTCAVLEEVDGDMAKGSIHGAVERLASVSQSQAIFLLDAFTEDPEKRSVELAANVIRGLSEIDLSKAHTQAAQLTESNLESLRCAGLSALGRLDYDNSYDLAEDTVRRLDEACEPDHSEQVASIVAQALGTLLKRGLPNSLHTVAEDRFLGFASEGSPKTRYVVAKVIQGAVYEGEGQEWMQDSLLALASTPAEHEGILDCIDSTLFSIVKDDLEWVLKYIRTFVKKRAYLREPPRHGLPHLLSSTIRSFGNEHLELLEEETTQWFASGKPGLQCAAADIFRWFESQPRSKSKALLSLDETVLCLLDDEQLKRIAFAGLGYHLKGEMVASILISLVWEDRRAQSMKEDVVDLLERVVLHNYPSETRKYLAGLSVRTDTPQHVFNVIKLATERSNDYYEALRDRPNLEELRSPERRLRKWKLVHREQSQRMQEAVRNESIAEKLFQRVPIKQGKGWFYEQDGEITEPKGFREFSSSVPVARSKQIDPVGFLRQRQWFRYEASVRAKGSTFKNDN